VLQHRAVLVLFEEALADIVFTEQSDVGNVRELRNVLERAAILCEGAGIDTTHLALESCVTFAVRRRTTATQEDRAFATRAISLRPIYVR